MLSSMNGFLSKFDTGIGGPGISNFRGTGNNGTDQSRSRGSKLITVREFPVMEPSGAPASTGAPDEEKPAAGYLALAV